MKKLLVTSVIILFTSNQAVAGDIELSIPTESAPERIVGLVVSKSGVLEKTGIEVENLEEPRAKAKVPVTFLESSADTLVTTMSLTSSSDIKFAPLKSIAAQEKEDKKALKPRCETSGAKADDQKLIGNMGALYSLAEVRKARRDLMRVEIANKLRGDFLLKLQNIETGLGLNADVQLTPDLSPAELNIRLFRILTVLKNYKKTE
jgi:hypothetical protein